jgi:lysyl-tRNA synthetase class 2
VLRLERHRLGPRVFVLGRRVHEWHLGALVVTAAVVTALLSLIRPVAAVSAGLIGLWLIVKDWPDLIHASRDTTGWRLGLHRRPLPLRPVRRLDDVPALAAIATAVVGIVDLVSAVTPNVSWRGDALVHVEPVSVMRSAHALAVPTSFALMLTAYYLYRRRSGALHIALGLMVALTVFNVVKGLDIEEAVLSVSCAGLLWASRSSFYGRHEPGTIRSAALRLPLLLAGAFLTALAVVAIAAPASASFGAILRETGDLLLWQPGPFGFEDELAKTGLAVELISILTVLAAAYVLFRPLAAPRDLPDAELRHAAAKLVHEHGTDTLAFFKLRTDKHYLFNPGRTAFVGYRTESGVLMISGDPVGEPPAVADLMRSVVAFAEERSLRIAAVGVSPAGRAVFEQTGLRALYIGDEAIVETQQFSLEGRAIRKVRQSVSRLEKAGYRIHSAELGSLDESVTLELEEVADDWRRGAPERGFSMAMDSLRNPHGAKTLVVYATDEQGAIRGFLHFVPSYGRNAVSLSFMRRRHDTPNGLTEFMIVEAIDLMRGRGVTEVSLNFSVFARLIREPEGMLERVAGRLIVLGDTWFQIERLYRFNAKFFPRWEPRYFMYERRFGLPRAGIAALWLEGQLPRPALRSRRRDLSRVWSGRLRPRSARGSRLAPDDPEQVPDDQHVHR